MEATGLREVLPRCGMEEKKSKNNNRRRRNNWLHLRERNEKKKGIFLAEKVPLGTFLDNRANEECKLNNGVGKSPCASFTFSTSFSTAGGCPEACPRAGPIVANSFFTTYAAKFE
jgi:hypothetical protein